MQVGRIVRQVVLQPDPHDVAEPHPQQRRQIGIVVEKSGEFVFAEPHTGLRGHERGVEHAVAAADLRRLDQGLTPGAGAVGAQQPQSRAQQPGPKSSRRRGGKPGMADALEEGAAVMGARFGIADRELSGAVAVSGWLRRHRFGPG